MAAITNTATVVIHAMRPTDTTTSWRIDSTTSRAGGESRARIAYAPYGCTGDLALAAGGSAARRGHTGRSGVAGVRAPADRAARSRRTARARASGRVRGGARGSQPGGRWTAAVLACGE